MSHSPTESQTAAAAPAAFTTPGTLIAIGVWACLFTLFIVLGLNS
jgi:hypothetical protein